MPFTFKVHPEDRVVMVTLGDSLNREEINSFYAALRSNPDFVPTFSELIDARRLVNPDLRHTDFFDLKVVTPFAPTARRAIIVSDKASVFGTARMWATINDPEPGEHMQVFKDENEARTWVQTDLPFPSLISSRSA